MKLKQLYYPVESLYNCVVTMRMCCADPAEISVFNKKFYICSRNKNRNENVTLTFYQQK